MWDLVPWPGIEPGPPAVGAWSLNHWTTREVPSYTFYQHYNTSLQSYYFHPSLMVTEFTDMTISLNLNVISLFRLVQIYPRGSNHRRRSNHFQRTTPISHGFTFHFAYLWNISRNINSSLFNFDSFYVSLSCFLSFITLLVVNLNSVITEELDFWSIATFFFVTTVILLWMPQYCFFKKFYLFYLFLAALGLHCWAWASHCNGFSCGGARVPGARASVVVARGLSSCGLQVLECRLSSCGARA